VLGLAELAVIRPNVHGKMQPRKIKPLSRRKRRRGRQREA
jgi:hypothetical protein